MDSSGARPHSNFTACGAFFGRLAASLAGREIAVRGSVREPMKSLRRAQSAFDPVELFADGWG